MDEIGRLATAPLPTAVTAAALSHLRDALKRHAQLRAIKRTVHKPAPPRAVSLDANFRQDANFRRFDPFQPAHASTGRRAQKPGQASLVWGTRQGEFVIPERLGAKCEP